MRLQGAKTCSLLLIALSLHHLTVAFDLSPGCRSQNANHLFCIQTLPSPNDTDQPSRYTVMNLYQCCGRNGDHIPRHTFAHLPHLVALSIVCQFAMDGPRTMTVDNGTWAATTTTLSALIINDCNLPAIPGGGNGWRASQLVFLTADHNRIPSLAAAGLGIGCRTQCGVTGTVTSFVYPYVGRLMNASFASNQISRIDEHDLCDVPSLRYLNLRDNRIDFVARTAFAAQRQLVWLDLSQNALRHHHFLDPCPPAPVIHLQTFNLASNLLQELDGVLKQQVSSLTYLSLANNSIAELPDRFFENATNLSFLDLSGNHIERVNLTGLTNLAHLNLTNNSLTDMHPEALASCRGSLKQFLVAGNHLERMPNVANASALTLVDASRNAIRTWSAFNSMYSLDRLDLTHNNLTDLSFARLPLGLRYLGLGYNRISVINNYHSPTRHQWRPGVAGTAYTHIHLDTLDLTSNRLTRLGGTDLPNSVKRLLLRDNQINSVDRGTFADAFDLTLLDLTNNALSRPCATWFTIVRPDHPRLDMRPQLLLHGNPLRCTCETTWLLDWMGNVADVSPYATDLYGTKCRLDNGTELFMATAATLPLITCKSTEPCACINGESPCPLARKCPPGCDCEYARSAVGVICIGANWTRVAPSVGTVILQMWDNNIPQLDNTSFQIDYQRMFLLDLRRNRLRRISRGTFSSLSELNELDLSFNLLEELGGDAFAGLAMLGYLRLANNRLRYLAAEIFLSLGQLKLLTLHDNRLANFQVWSFKKVSPALTITLGSNPWNCSSCDYVRHFREVFMDANVKVLNADQVLCAISDEEGNPILVEDAGAPLLQLNNSQRCYPSTVVQVGTAGDGTVTSACISISVIVLIVAILLVNYRYEVRVLLHHHYGIRLFETARRRNSRDDKNDDGSDRPYDVFVSYSQEDETFLVEHLLPRLDDRHPTGTSSGYRLCLHHRDFLVGGYINESIIQAVACSRRTLVVLTPSYVASDWCVFEFKMAHAEMLSRGASAHGVVVVLPDGTVPAGAADHNELRLFLEQATYLRWGDRLFWHKLGYALPDRRSNGTVVSDMNVLRLEE